MLGAPLYKLRRLSYKNLRFESFNYYFIKSIPKKLENTKPKVHNNDMGMAEERE